MEKILEILLDPCLTHFRFELLLRNSNLSLRYRREKFFCLNILPTFRLDFFLAQRRRRGALEWGETFSFNQYHSKFLLNRLLGNFWLNILFSKLFELTENLLSHRSCRKDWVVGWKSNIWNYSSIENFSVTISRETFSISIMTHRRGMRDSGQIFDIEWEQNSMKNETWIFYIFPQQTRFSSLLTHPACFLASYSLTLGYEWYSPNDWLIHIPNISSCNNL